MESSAEEKETGRVEAFSDGVFSIAITLLILEIKVPDMIGNRELLKLWPSYLAYFISFFTILIMWANHHRIFNYIRRVDNTFLFLNGFLLLIVAFVPFPTAVLARFIQTPKVATTAAAFYTGTYVMIAVAFNVLWHYAVYKYRLLGRSVKWQDVRRVTRSYFFGPPVFFIAFVLAFFNVAASLTVFTVLSFFFAFFA